ncbi:hypothetical protein ILUMI_26146 [Ignelater luminosus]|uniref:Uncharacterized protein n=1 Tax=Ignelater luminosus TaxID=2038154 RepID=A0A8K0C419_IGNLU|nr:hypothetical protein ILUMI_26146 [Ignelater luminosus]
MPPKRTRRKVISNKATLKECEAIEAKIKKYEEVKATLTKMFEQCKERWVQTDVEWLALRNVVIKNYNTKTSNPIIEQTALFKDATELNSIPITVTNTAVSLETQDVQCEVEVESSDED